MLLAGLRDGVEPATGIAKGIVFSMIANIFFAVVLFVTLPRFGLWKALALVTAVFLAAITALIRISP